MVDMAMKFGSLKSILPDGIKSLIDAPWSIVAAIQYAMMIISWHSLPSEEQPPREIWQNDEKIIKWFEAIKRHREGGGVRGLKNKNYEYIVRT